VISFVSTVGANSPQYAFCQKSVALKQVLERGTYVYVHMKYSIIELTTAFDKKTIYAVKKSMGNVKGPTKRIKMKLVFTISDGVWKLIMRDYLASD